MDSNSPTPILDATTSTKEIALHQRIENGPVKNVGRLFADVLTVPKELCQRIFYWPEEREFCEHISSVGRALDTLTTVHRTFLGQFKVLSNLRASFIQAPTEFFVAPMYFCDRALDSLLRSTRKVQNDIEGLFKDLGQLEAECSWRYRWTKKAFLEDKYPKGTSVRNESTMRPDMKIKEQRVILLAEVRERIRMVRRGGSNVFSLIGRQWLPGYAEDSAPRRPDDVVKIASGVADMHQHERCFENRNGSAQLEVDSNGPLVTPVPQHRENLQSQSAKDCDSREEIPETPEIRRTGGVVMTQRSSPRKRKPTQSSSGSRAVGSSKQGQPVARNLIGDAPSDLQDSPAQKSGTSMEAIRTASVRDDDARTAHDRAENGDLQEGNQIGMGLLDADNDRPTSDARTALHNPPQDQEKLDEKRVQSASI